MFHYVFILLSLLVLDGIQQAVAVHLECEAAPDYPRRKEAHEENAKGRNIAYRQQP
jgi:hypothetical protein